MTAIRQWLPAGVLAFGAFLTLGVDTQRSLPLELPLADVVPNEIATYVARDVQVSDDELRVAGVSEHLMRNYETARTGATRKWFSLYIGYYDRQTQGKTAHSPRNCLPGGGWQPLLSRRATVATTAGAAEVNRYLLQKGNDIVLVLYWYQGRGRVEANEYLVKWDLLRDSAIRQRSEEALVRIVVPVTDGEEAAYALASSIAAQVIPTLYTALPN